MNLTVHLFCLLIAMGLFAAAAVLPANGRLVPAGLFFVAVALAT